MPVLFHTGHAATPSAPETAHGQAVEPRALSCPYAEWRPGPSPHQAHGCCGVWAPGASAVGLPPPRSSPGSLFLLSYCLRFRCWLGVPHRTLWAHCVGPSADEAPGVLLRHKMRARLTPPPILSGSRCLCSNYLSFHVSTMNWSQSQLCGLAGSWLFSLARLHSASRPQPICPKKEARAQRRLCGDALPT